MSFSSPHITHTNRWAQFWCMLSCSLMDCSPYLIWFWSGVMPCAVEYCLWWMIRKSESGYYERESGSVDFSNGCGILHPMFQLQSAPTIYQTCHSSNQDLAGISPGFTWPWQRNTRRTKGVCWQILVKWDCWTNTGLYHVRLLQVVVGAVQTLEQSCSSSSCEHCYYFFFIYIFIYRGLGVPQLTEWLYSCRFPFFSFLAHSAEAVFCIGRHCQQT